MATMNVSFPDPMKTWVEAQLKDGRFSNTSDYVRIRRDQERARAIEALQQAVDEGLKSGAAEPFDFKAFKARMRERHVRQESVQLSRDARGPKRPGRDLVLHRAAVVA